MSQAGLVDIEGSHPQIPTSFVTNDGDAVPILNVLEILGTVVAAHGIPLETTGSGNTVTVVAQYASSNGSSVASKAGLASFNSTFFTVDANGFVSLTGTGIVESFTVDAFTAPGTQPVVPNGSGNVTVTGAQVEAGTIANVIRTNSLAANTYAIQIQRSQAVASSTVGDNGVSHFDSTAFGVDANGYVTLNSTAVGVLTVSGTANRITSTGGQNPVIDIAATYVGQTSITTLGTIATGVWQGTAVAADHGGTGLTTYATGDIVYSGSVNPTALSKLVAGSNGQVLTLAAGIPSWATPTTGTVTSVSGTANRITSTGGATPVIDIAATYVGQTSITTLGTVTTGVWNGTAINETHGGTNQTTYATGDILYASGANTLSKLAAGSNTQVLTLAAGVPSWATPTTGTVTSVSGTANRITSTGGATPVIDISAAYVGQTSITTLGTITTGVWNGTTITVANGGTGNTTFTAYSVICAGTTSTGTFQNVSGVGTSGQVLTSNGAAALPTWQTNGSGTGDVVGPGSSTDNALVRFDGTTGKLIQNGVITEDDTGNLSIAASVSGATLSALVSNTSNTASSQALHQAQVAGSTAADAFFQANINGGQSWVWGLDNSASDAFVVASSSALGTTNIMSSATSGEINYPLQPAFFAYQASVQSDVTGNGTAYTLGTTTDLTEVFDQNGDFDPTSGVFTAPVTGRYFLYTTIQMNGITSAMTLGQCQISTSNRLWLASYLNCAAARTVSTLPDYYGFFCTAYADMDAADTATAIIQINGGAGNTADVVGGSNTGVCFAGFLHC